MSAVIFFFLFPSRLSRESVAPERLASRPKLKIVISIQPASMSNAGLLAKDSARRRRDSAVLRSQLWGQFSLQTRPLIGFEKLIFKKIYLTISMYRFGNTSCGPNWPTLILYCTFWLTLSCFLSRQTRMGVIDWQHIPRGTPPCACENSRLIERRTILARVRNKGETSSIFTLNHGTSRSGSTVME